MTMVNAIICIIPPVVLYDLVYSRDTKLHFLKSGLSANLNVEESFYQKNVKTGTTELLFLSL
jgi:hypothetical protein